MSYKNEEFGRVNYKPEDARQNRKTTEEKLAAVEHRRKIEEVIEERLAAHSVGMTLGEYRGE